MRESIKKIDRREVVIVIFVNLEGLPAKNMRQELMKVDFVHKKKSFSFWHWNVPLMKSFGDAVNGAVSATCRRPVSTDKHGLLAGGHGTRPRYTIMAWCHVSTVDSGRRAPHMEVSCASLTPPHTFT
jgi:hypothetical protein